jgi:tRNA nucleotidyltransferase (CCA-adding enzyme)
VEIYLVGGAVRDKLLGLPVRERDWVVVGSTAEDMLAEGYQQVGKDFPVFLHPESHEEYALARTERKSGHGYKGFLVHAEPDVTLEEDLKRRDLTVNAIAESKTGDLIDPFNGQNDLNAGLLRHVSPAFAEDPVRILRVARFAARFEKHGFHVAHKTNDLMRQMVDDGEVDYLVPERIWAELEKALQTDRPHIFFKILRGCGALAILFPEIDNPAFLALELTAQNSTDPRVRFSTLLLSLASDGTTKQRQQIAESICSRIKIPNEYRELTVRAIQLEHLANSSSAEQLAELLESSGAYRDIERWKLLLDVFEFSQRIDKQQRTLITELQALTAPISASDITTEGLKGPEIGQAIRNKRLELVHNHLMPQKHID